VNANYARSVCNTDAYGSTGRKRLQMAALLGPGVAIRASDHAGYAGSVDVKTGDLVW
jgi:hypothetical protein